MCSANVLPVCGEDGLPYQSACVAQCAGVKVQHTGYCKPAAKGGEALKLDFSVGSRASRKERQQVITRDVMTQYVEAGFRYLGRVRLAEAPSGPKAADLRRSQQVAEKGANMSSLHHASAAEAAAEALKAASKNKLHHVLRYTPSGDVYYAAFNATGASGMFNLTRIPPEVPRNMRWVEEESGLESQGSGAAGRALRMIIGPDERATCGQPPRYPLTAIGQLDFVQQSQDYICSGALVRRDRVLTAAHCVWSIAERAFVRGVAFAAGRYRMPNGIVVSPFGVQAWKHVTLVSDFPSGSAAGSDMAVIQLDNEVSEDAGTMGVEAGCSTSNDWRPMTMQTAGYASDKSNGECVMGACTVSLGCGADATQHTCDTFMVRCL